MDFRKINYLKYMIKRKLAIFASGSGTNAENIIQYFKNSKKISVACVLTNKPGAPVIDKAKKYNIPVKIFNKDDLNNNEVAAYLENKEIDLIVLAGFLWLIPQQLIKLFPKRIINIHPALLPKFGGKGMYGTRVHSAVLNSGEKETGITIHYIDNKYDEGEIIFQKSFKINHDQDTVELIEKLIHQLEYKYYPQIIEKLLLEK